MENFPCKNALRKKEEKLWNDNRKRKLKGTGAWI